MSLLTKEQGQLVLDAIHAAEHQTSGEIRVHLEKFCELNDTFQRALEVFYWLEMDKTEMKNGILIYIAYEDKKMAIVGDEGINRVVPKEYWDEILEIMRIDFSQSLFAEGICKAIQKVGEKLKTHFPYHDGDKNELTDQISGN